MIRSQTGTVVPGWAGSPGCPETPGGPAPGQPSRRGPFPGQAQVCHEWPGEAELGMAGDDQPGPPVGGGRVAEIGGGPAEDPA